jgi:nucleoside-diphosphate-sugar epimerase
MKTLLVTPATSFLGYHAVKRLNEAGIRPRVLELPGSKTEVPERLDADRCTGHLRDPAAANKLLQALISGKLRFTLPVGFGCLDVRDFAHGMVLAAKCGRSGERYLLSGDNVTTNQLLERASAIAGVRAPRFKPPTFLLYTLVGALEFWCAIRHKPAPVTRDVLQIIGRYAWYHTAKARAELHWRPRPLRHTLDDTIQWLRDPAVTLARVQSGGGTATEPGGEPRALAQ